MKKILEQIRTLGLFITGGVGYHLIYKTLNIKSDKEDDAKMDRIEKNTENISNKQESFHEEMKNKVSELNELAKKHFYDKNGNVKDNVNSNVSESLTDHVKGIKDIVIKRLSEAQKGGLEKQAEIENLQKVLVKTDELSDSIKEINNKFLSGLTNFFEYLDTLTLLQESSLFHFFIFIVILVSLINIIIVLFANEFINYFNLENRFPKLSIFFKLRLKWQKFYLITSFTILFILCFFAIFINILLFIN